ncbi:FecCD family ABC transporter permease [Thalassiella azotivora]
MNAPSSAPATATRSAQPFPQPSSQTSPPAPGHPAAPPSAGLGGRRAARVGPLSLVLRPRPLAVVVAALAAVAVLASLSMAVGDYPITPWRVLQVLLGGGEPFEQVVVTGLRAPRTVTGLVVGAALAVAGALMQAVVRNPLASPDLLGVTAGAGAGAVAVIVLAGSGGLAGGLAGQVGVPAAALAGGTVAAALVYGLAWRQGVDGYRFVLVGVALASALFAVVSWLLVLADIKDATRATVWLTGSLNARGWPEALPVVVGLVVLLPLAVVLGARLGVLQLGDDVARSLGLGVERVRFTLLAVSVLLASLATAAAGPVAFVALVSPQVARLLARTPRPPLVASALVGAALVTASDLVARELLPVQLPVGIVTAVVGAPYLLWLLARASRKASA